MSEFMLHRLGILMEPDAGNARKVESVINPAAVRGSDRDRFGTTIKKTLLEGEPKLSALLAAFPPGRMSSVDTVGGGVTVMVSDDASYITGSTFVVDGGLMRNYRSGNDAREN